jgi:hypothetical protein
MSSHSDKMRATMQRRVQQTASYHEQHPHQSVGVDLGDLAASLADSPSSAPDDVALRSLEEVVEAIRYRVAQTRKHKRALLKEMLYLRTHWDRYTAADDMEPFRGHRGFVKFVKTRVEQDERTSTGDVRIVAMLEKHDEADLLDSPTSDLVHNLRRIASVQDANDEEAAEQKQKELLQKVRRGDVQRDELERDIKNFNEAKEARRQPPKPEVLSRSWRCKTDRRNKRIVLSGIPDEQIEKLNLLLNELDEELLSEFLQHPKLRPAKTI